MWDAFLDRTSQSCESFGTPKTSFAKRKLDLNSIEYQSYIRKDVLGYLDKATKLPRGSQRKMKSASACSGTQKDKTEKYKPVYLKVEKLQGETSDLSKCQCCKKKSARHESSYEKMHLCNNISKKISYELLNKNYVAKGKKKSPRRKTPSPKPKEPEMRPEEGIRRHTILVLRKKNPKKGESTIAADSCKFEPYGTMFGKTKLYVFGERGSGFKTSGEPQDFYKLREQHLANGTLFEDPEFPAANSSLFFSQQPDRYYEWKRPHEISDNPQFFVEGYSRFDVQQGELGDCWLLAAAANLTLYQRLFLQIVPDDQDFDDQYAGIFHFRFWRYGRWVDVVIDDRLPTYRGQLIFLHSSEENEFWSALLEKAYAKMHGSYEALKGGSTCEAMEDFTGGVTEMYEMEACPPNLFQIMLKAYERASLMGCSIEPDPNVLEAQTPEGLVRGHAYSITRVQYVDIQTPNVTGKIPLLRLRNPWGNETEWNGPWSDESPEWRFISESEKEELGLTFDTDGEFWMSFKDFQKHFSRVEICNLNPDSLSQDELREGNKKKWEMSVFEGEWVRGVTAGGCRNFLDSFWHNPQYRITLTEIDEGDDEDLCTLIVALMQKNRRRIRSTGADLLTIGFAIYHLPYPDRVPKPLDMNFFKYNASVARSPSFINLREVSCRFKLPPGTYCIVPSTFDPNEDGEFLLRVFSENKNIMEENDQKIGFGSVDKEVVALDKNQVDTFQQAPSGPPPIPVNEPILLPKKSLKSLQSKIAGFEPSVDERQETDKVHGVFLKYAGDDMEVDWEELKIILDSVMQDDLTKDGFSKDMCRSMIAMMDTNGSGKLGYDEFQNLWESLNEWKNVWSFYDKDNSGTFSGFELRQALESAGYLLNMRILNVLMRRYGNKHGQVRFDDFMMCAIKVKTMIDVFKDKDQNETDTATFSMEEWLEKTLST